MPRKKKDLRAIIRTTLEGEGGTVYELAARAHDAEICNRSTVYRYLSEDSSISSDVLEWILDDLGLEVIPRSGVPALH